MKLNETDKEILNGLIENFIQKYGYEQGTQIITDIYRLHRKISKDLCIVNFPIPRIYRSLVAKKMKTPVSKGGYKGLSLEEIAERENVSLRVIKSIALKGR